MAGDAASDGGTGGAGGAGGGANGKSREGGAKSIGHYVLMKTIGEGTFGKVKLGTHLLTGERVAVKVLEKERIVEIADVERVAREIHILKLIKKSRHIIQMYEIIETPKQLYLIMEYAPGGELFDYIVEQGRAEEKTACKFLHQILAGLEQIHSHSVVHRDLKPENLLLTDKKDIKIVDFGLSNTFSDGQLLRTACGSPAYAAPEMIQNLDYHPPAVDVWSCGVILFALVCGYLPFEDPNHVELYRKICAAEYDIPKFVSSQVANLIRGMLNTDPAKRLTVQQIREHPWYKQIPEASLRESDECGDLEEYVLDQLDGYGYSREQSMKCLSGNKHNHLTTTYQLLKDRRLRELDLQGPAKNEQVAALDACCADEDEEVEPNIVGTQGNAKGGQGGKRQAAARAPAVAHVATPSRGASPRTAPAVRPGSNAPSARAGGRPADADVAAGAPRSARGPKGASKGGKPGPEAGKGRRRRGGQPADGVSGDCGGTGGAEALPVPPQSARGRGQGQRWEPKAPAAPASARGPSERARGGPQATPRARPP